MDEDQYRKKMAELLRMAAATSPLDSRSSEHIALAAHVEGIAMCFEASVKIGTGTGESAAQVMARAKDMFRACEAWSKEGPKKAVRK